MGNRIPFNTIYFYGNCEEELIGFPAGERLVSGRPLCQRCAEIGFEEGWGRLHQAPAGMERIEEPSKRASLRGICSLLFFLVITALACFCAILLFGRGERR